MLLLSLLTKPKSAKMSLGKTSCSHCQAFLTKGWIFFFFLAVLYPLLFEDRHTIKEGLITVGQDCLVLMVSLVRILDQDTLEEWKGLFLGQDLLIL